MGRNPFLGDNSSEDFSCALGDHFHLLNWVVAMCHIPIRTENLSFCGSTHELVTYRSPASNSMRLGDGRPRTLASPSPIPPPCPSVTFPFVFMLQLCEDGFGVEPGPRGCAQQPGEPLQGDTGLYRAGLVCRWISTSFSDLSFPEFELGLKEKVVVRKKDMLHVLYLRFAADAMKRG